jgi:hypothetical protein
MGFLYFAAAPGMGLSEDGSSLDRVYCEWKGTWFHIFCATLKEG